MAKAPKKGTSRKIKDLEPDATSGAKVKGGRDVIPSRRAIYDLLNKIAKPRSS